MWTSYSNLRSHDWNSWDVSASICSSETANRRASELRRFHQEIRVWNVCFLHQNMMRWWNRLWDQIRSSRDVTWPQSDLEIRLCGLWLVFCPGHLIFDTLWRLLWCVQGLWSELCAVSLLTAEKTRSGSSLIQDPVFILSAGSGFPEPKLFPYMQFHLITHKTGLF